MGRLRVATFNIRNGLALDWQNSWPLRRRATLGALAELGADVVGLQEVYGFQLRWLTARLPGMAAAGDGRSRRRHGEHVPILVRTARAEVVNSTTRWFGASPATPGTKLGGASFPRIATTAHVRLRDGAELSVTSTHFDERSDERRLASASQLVGWLADDPLPHVVVGDLNATPGSGVVARLVEAGFKRVDTGASGTTHRFSGRTDGRIIDHILLRGAITVEAAGVNHQGRGGRRPSDHWPVWADVVLDPPS